MKVIVFGGAGFLGSHVADALAERGHEVTVFDQRPSPYLRKGQSMVVGDIQDADAVRRAMRGKRVAYNFAGHADIESARHRPLETVRANIVGNTVLLEEARRARVRRFVYASTVYVYSRAGTFYRASKQACEAYVESYQEVFGLPYTILRFGTLYGPRAGETNSIHRLLRQALTEGRMVYWGTGEELREYIHVRDAAASAVDILSREFENACVTITGSQPLRARDLLVMIREILRPRVPVVIRPGSRPGLADTHYAVTPYSFVPKEGKKLVRTHYVDLGQGLLSLIGEMHRGKAGSPP